MDETQAFLMCVGVRSRCWCHYYITIKKTHPAHRLSLHAEIWARRHRRAVFAATHGLEAVHQGNGELRQCALPC